MTAPGPGEYPAGTPISAITQGGPTVLRIMLGSHLRRLREVNQISREDAGEAIRASHSKISRIELGRVSFKERDIADLLTLYGVTDQAERKGLLSLAREANTPGWWHRYGDVLPDWFELYIGLEEAATTIRTHEVRFVPELLQTEQYARAAISLCNPEASADEIERRVSLRLRRQHLLTRPDPAQLWAVVDESVLRRLRGHPDIMQAQLEHLMSITRLPHVTLQIMPFDLGGHAAASGTFSILRFAEPDLPDVVYLEQLTSALYLDKSSDVAVYMDRMDRLCVRANPPATTPETLKSLLPTDQADTTPEP